MARPGGKTATFPTARNPSTQPSPKSSGCPRKVLASIILGFALCGSAAFAEDAAKVKAPDFVPFVVDQTQAQAAMSYLNGLKFGDAAPLVKWLNELEERAKGQWEADHAPKPVETPK